MCVSVCSHDGGASLCTYAYIVFPATLAFRCAYCFTLNPSRKKLPTAPRLDRQASQGSSTSTPNSTVLVAAEVKGGSGKEQQQGPSSADGEEQKEATQQEESSHPQQEDSETASATTAEVQSSS